MCRNRLYLRENKLSAYFSDAIEDIADALGAYELGKASKWSEWIAVLCYSELPIIN